MGGGFGGMVGGGGKEGGGGGVQSHWKIQPKYFFILLFMIFTKQAFQKNVCLPEIFNLEIKTFL